MGGSQTKPQKLKDDKPPFDEASKSLISPVERAERRYMRVYATEESSGADIDQTVDRYDYLIVFPYHKGKELGGDIPSTYQQGGFSGGGGAADEGSKDVEKGWCCGLCPTKGDKKKKPAPEKDSHVNMQDILDTWYSAIPGDEGTKKAAQEKLRRELVGDRFGALEAVGEWHTEILTSKWNNAAREVIVRTLYQMSGLQLKLTKSRDEKSILCRIRAPISLLEQQAALENFPLQFHGEVDPGYEFWTEAEIEEELRLLSKDQANEILEKLYEAEKISANDLAVFDEEATDKIWSRRVHTLERIADKVPVTNRFPAYAPFSLQPKDRHLYQTYPSIRGRTLFRAKERLILTRSIITSYFDIGVLQENGVVTSMTALHDANRGDKITTDVLQKWWCRFWSDDSTRVGAPMVSMIEMDEGQSVSWYMRPFSQPIEDVRSYFGEKLAFYFAWLGFYGWSLVFPAVVCVAAEVYIWANNIQFASMKGFDPVQVGVVVMTIVWSAVYEGCWKREEHVIAVKWGTRGFEETEKDRPQFKGDTGAPGTKGGRRRSQVTNTYETYFPQSKREARQFGGLSVIVFFILCLLVSVQLNESLGQYLIVEKGYSWGSYCNSVISAVQIQILSAVYGKVVVGLNDYENYQTETAYEHSLIFKTFLFQMFNNYSALFYQAFLSGYLYGCESSCVLEVRNLLVTIFMIRFMAAFMELLSPTFQRWSAAWLAEDEDTKKDDKDPQQQEGESKQEEELFEQELTLLEYDGTFSDYAAIVLQYGYITMFVSALPLVIPLAMVEILLQMRLDSYKLVRLMRRPDPELAEEVGMWTTLMASMSFFSVFSNTAIICFSSGTMVGVTLGTRCLVCIAAEHVLLGLKVATHFFIPNPPKWVETVEARQKFVVEKHKHGFLRGEDMEAAKTALSAGNLDVVGMQFPKHSQKLRGVKKEKDKEANERSNKLAAAKRDATRQLQTAKEQLKLAYQNETFNEAKGIGETKHGLPLGCLNVKLIKIQGLDISGLGEPSDLTVVMSLRSTKSDTEPPGPAPQPSRPAVPGEIVDQIRSLEFNQVFVMAPVKTQDADLLFDVLLRRSGAPHNRLGKCSIPLRDLADQTEHDFPLSLQKKSQSGKWEPVGEARLFAKVKFMYSKIVPLRNKIYLLQDKIRGLDRDITLLMSEGPDGGGTGD